MMTYITKDDTKISDSTFAHFVLHDIHYVACHDIFAYKGSAKDSLGSFL